MCGRSSLHDAPTSVLERFHLPPVLPGFKPRYNICPSQDQLTIALDDAGVPAALPRRWGLVPYWANDPSVGNRMINARAESIADKPSYSLPFEKRRCLIVADGYYEWMVAGKSKVPVFFHMTGHRPFVIAGLWDRWEKGTEPLETCVVITTEAGSRASRYHDRMPALLAPDDAEEWLDLRTPRGQALELLRPYDEADLECYPVSRYVNNPANDSPQCMQRADDPGDEKGRQPAGLLLDL